LENLNIEDSSASGLNVTDVKKYVVKK